MSQDFPVRGGMGWALSTHVGDDQTAAGRRERVRGHAGRRGTDRENLRAGYVIVNLFVTRACTCTGPIEHVFEGVLHSLSGSHMHSSIEYP